MSEAALRNKTIAWIGLGANMGDPIGQLIKARNYLSEQLEIIGASSLYRSAPIECLTSQDDYFNAVIAVHTRLDPHTLLEFLLNVEQRMGRMRTGYHSPRTLDLDLLLYGADCLQDDILTVPHPAMHQRAFVLKPLCEVAPFWKLPNGAKAADMLESVKNQKIEHYASEQWPLQLLPSGSEYAIH